MHEFNPIPEVGGGIELPPQEQDDFRIIGITTYYNYFCLKLSCFEAYFGTQYGILKDCPICKKNDKVVSRFGKK